MRFLNLSEVAVFCPLDTFSTSSTTATATMRPEKMSRTDSEAGSAPDRRTSARSGMAESQAYFRPVPVLKTTTVWSAPTPVARRSTGSRSPVPRSQIALATATLVRP